MKLGTERITLCGFYVQGCYNANALDLIVAWFTTQGKEAPNQDPPIHQTCMLECRMRQPSSNPSA